VQYADDTLLIMEACPKQLFFLKAILNSFASSTGLRVNYNKSNMYPINVNAEKMEILSRTLNCQIGEMSFTYLGLPLGLAKPRIQQFLPLIQRIEKRLSCSSIFLSQVGRLELVNSAFTALPTFFMCTLKIPKSIIKQIDIYRKQCLWRGNDTSSKKSPLVAWSMVTQRKVNGGLGVLRLETQNDALLLKFFHKFFNSYDLPWEISSGINIIRLEDFLVIEELAPSGGRVCSNFFTTLRAWRTQSLAMVDQFFSGKISGIRVFQDNNIQNYSLLQNAQNCLSQRLRNKIISFVFFNCLFLNKLMNNTWSYR
jgi:hypothetical protein